MADDRFEVRAVTAADIPAIRRLNMVALPIQVADHIYREALQVAGAPSWVAVHHASGAIAGAILVHQDVDTRVCIRTLAVDVRHRGQGLGLRLVTQTLEAAAGHITYLHVQVDNTDAIALYKRAGFLVQERLTNYYRRVACPDCFIMLHNAQQSG
ncbi:hypothetical protein ACHHYP_16693 [Achlya hypogyna]|uniref:N-acetyltransferase domain-containing protein n=1 Tax=Achlya hypogyna TaxID=1202772 RepID=A0A1V9Y654_ACHHY|nr:hypothetical protein ACHHYP_16693 [Achlya hypogyna]